MLLDKMRLHLRGELHYDYQENFGALKALDGVCRNFLRVHHCGLIECVKQGGADEEILGWCFEKGRRLNDGDPLCGTDLHRSSGGAIRSHRVSKKEKSKWESPIATTFIPDLIDFDEGRFPEASKTL